jgi:hypothetical protein
LVIIRSKGSVMIGKLALYWLLIINLFTIIICLFCNKANLLFEHLQV